MVKASEDAVVEEGAEDARGSIVLQFFSVQLEIYFLYLSIYFAYICMQLEIYLYVSMRVAAGNI